MDLNQVFAAIEASQSAKANGATAVANDEAKAAAIAAQLAADKAAQVDLVAKADSDINAGIAALQSLLSTAQASLPLA